MINKLTRRLLWLPYKIINLLQRFCWYIGLPWHNHIYNECTSDFNCCETFKGYSIQCNSCTLYYGICDTGIHSGKCKDCGSVDLTLINNGTSQRFSLFRWLGEITK